MGRAQRGGRVTSSDAYKRAGWRVISCEHCNGTGLAYVRQGGDPRGPISGQERCRECQGRSGWWRSPQGARAAYPGGPWI